MKRYLMALAAVSLCTSVLAQSVVSSGASSTITSRDGSTVSAGPGGSVILDNQGSVTSSTRTDGTGVTTSSMVSRNGSTCSTVYQGQRCEISCQAPQVAQCGKSEQAGQPACFCSN